MKKMTVYRKTALLLAAVMSMSLCSGVTTGAQEVAGKTDNPNVGEISGTIPNVKATWDCVWFGSYPQAEIVESAESYAAVEQSILEDGDIIEDAGLYQSLKNAEDGQWEGGDITLDGQKYRRIKSSDVVGLRLGTVDYKWESDDTSYHYFKYEPVKWRVLKVDGNQAFLLSDTALDTQVHGTPVQWEGCGIRRWLNGNTTENDKLYVTKSFIESAFDEKEKAAIVETDVVNAPNSEYLTSGGSDTKDKIFLLSESESSEDSARAYGFGIPASESAVTRKSKSSTYAKAMGIQFKATDTAKGFSAWWLRTPGHSIASSSRSMETGNIGSDARTLDTTTGVRSALNLDLSSGSGACYAGKVCSDGTVEETPAEDNEAIDNLGNPKTQYASGKIGTRLKVPMTKEGLNGVETAIWDCVWFGSYPQAEVVASTDAYNAIAKDRLGSVELIEDAELYKKLTDAQDNDWEGNDVTLDGERYRRIKKADATYGSGPHYTWEDDVTYHYFKYEPIKWRVFNVDKERAFLFTDVVLDTQGYNVLQLW